MHLIERYALATGSKIKKPFIVKKFFPVGAEKYITIQNSSGMPGKCYDYFQEVINFLKQKLDKYGYKIVQIGAANDQPISGAIFLNGKTNINQTAYVLENSSLHIGNDSFAVHMCSAFGVPCVGLYGITTPSIAGPYWNKDKCISLCPDNFVPSFNPSENPKKVNEIKIENVVSSCEKLLFGTNEISIKTQYIGNRYSEKIIETLPDQVIHPDFFKGHVLNIRIDYAPQFNNINILANNIASRPCAIVTDRAIEHVELLAQFKQNLNIIIYEVTNGVDIKFVEKLHTIGFNYICVFDTDSKNSLEDIKYKLMEFCGVETFNRMPKDCPNELPENCTYYSNRIILANGKIYISYSAYLEDVSINSAESLFQDLNLIKDKQKFKEDLSYCMIVSNNSIN